MYVFVYTCVSETYGQLCYWLNVHLGKQQPCPSAWTETPGPQALAWALVAGQEGPGLELQEVVSAPNVP